MPRLTVSIVTKNRLRSFARCIKNLNNTPCSEEVKVSILDNSSLPVYFIKKCIAKYYGKKLNFEMDHYDSFIKCRNMALMLCKTPYFTILDDDDRFTTHGLETMLKYIKTDEYDMISFNCEKSSNITEKSFGRDSYRVIDKLFSLNDFDNYAEDKHTKIYLWNCAHVFRKDLLYYSLNWKYFGCDDVLPITSAYCAAKNILKVNCVVYTYDRQNTVCKPKDPNELYLLELNLHKSYITLYHHQPEANHSIITKALHNSIRQLEHIDNFTPELLIDMYNKHIVMSKED